MEIRIRCSNCDRDVLVDEAFAGGVCRCPHCKTTLAVPDHGNSRNGERPSQPAVRAEQPAPADAPPRTTRPHRSSRAGSTRTLYRLVILLLVGLSLVFAAATGVLLHRHLANEAGDGDTENAWDPADPAGPRGGLDAEIDGGSVAGVPIDGRVVYVIDAGSGMRQMYDYAAVLTRRSIDSLAEDQQYGIVLAREDAPLAMEGGFHDPGPEGETFLMGAVALGASDIAAAVNAAAGMNPDVIVLMTRKPLDDPSAVAGSVTGAGARLVTIALNADDATEASLAQAVEAAGGQNRNFTRSQLDDWLRRTR